LFNLAESTYFPKGCNFSCFTPRYSRITVVREHKFVIHHLWVAKDSARGCHRRLEERKQRNLTVLAFVFALNAVDWLSTMAKNILPPFFLELLPVPSSSAFSKSLL